MEKRELICIGCPLGCPLSVQIEGDQIEVYGHTCKRGEDYARKEVLSPTRIVTSSVSVTGGELGMVSVKTKEDIPKGKIFECMKEIHQISVKAPVAIGDIIIDNCAGTGIPVIATKNIAEA